MASDKTSFFTSLLMSEATRVISSSLLELEATYFVSAWVSVSQRRHTVARRHFNWCKRHFKYGSVAFKLASDALITVCRLQVAMRRVNYDVPLHPSGHEVQGGAEAASASCSTGDGDGELH